MSGDLFFYPNPLASCGQHERTPWFTCACCPPNVARFIAEMGGFAYGVEGDGIYVNLYASGTAAVETAAGKITLEQTTDYPWAGDVKIKIAPAKPGSWTLRLRIPGWAQGHPVPGDLYRYAGETKEKPALKVNGKDFPYEMRQRLCDRDPFLEGRGRRRARPADGHPACPGQSEDQGRRRPGGHRARPAGLLRRMDG